MNCGVRKVNILVKTKFYFIQTLHVLIISMLSNKCTYKVHWLDCKKTVFFFHLILPLHKVWLLCSALWIPLLTLNLGSSNLIPWGKYLFLLLVDDLLVSTGHMLSTFDSSSKVVRYFYFGHSLLLCCSHRSLYHFFINICDTVIFLFLALVDVFMSVLLCI